MKFFWLLFIASCSSAPRTPVDFKYSLDSRFTEDEKSAIREGVRAWPVAAVESEEGVYIFPHHPCPDGSVGQWSSTGLICLDVVYVRQNGGPGLSALASHEVGHALGAGHGLPGNVMAKFYNDMATKPTSMDVEKIK